MPVIAIPVRTTPKRIIQKFIGRFFFIEFQAAAYTQHYHAVTEVGTQAAAIALSNLKLIN